MSQIGAQNQALKPESTRHPVWWKIGAFFLAPGALIGIAILLSLAGASASGPSSNRVLNYQLRLTDNNGISVSDGTKNIKISFYDAATAGTRLHSDCGTVATPVARKIVFSGGAGTVLIGDITADASHNCSDGSAPKELPATLFNSPGLWIGISVEADAEMAPRKRVVAQGYSLNADMLDDLDTSAVGGTVAFVPVTDASGNLTLTKNLTVDGTTLFVDSTNDRIGIGTAAPATFKLQVGGSVGPTTDDAFDLGSPALRWRDLYLGPTSLHIASTAAETGTARDYKISIQETAGADQGKLRIIEGANEVLKISPSGDLTVSGAITSTSTGTTTVGGSQNINGTTLTLDADNTGAGATVSVIAEQGTDPNGEIRYNTATNQWELSNNGGAFSAIAAGGGGITGSGTAGQATFWTGPSAVSGDNAFFWDNTNKRLGLGTSGPTQRLTVAGNIGLTSTGTTLTTAATELVMEETGDEFGAVRLTLQNRTGLNGALFENPALELVDFMFKHSTSGTDRGFIRYEGRTAWDVIGAPEFQFAAAVVPATANPATALVIPSGAGLPGVVVLAPQSTRKGLAIMGAASQSANLLEVQNSAGTALFIVNASGDLVRIDNVAYNWPAAQGAASTVLQNDGDGNLSWAAAGGGGGITGTGTAGQATFWTAASTVSGDSAFFWDNSNKRLGIGTAAPAQKLDVTGNIQLTGSTTRLLADMTSSITTDPFAIQSSTLNGATSLDVLPNGTGTSGQVRVWNNSNRGGGGSQDQAFVLGIDAANAYLSSLDIGGLGTAKNIQFLMSGSVKMTLTNAGNFGIGTVPDTRLHVGSNNSTVSEKLKISSQLDAALEIVADVDDISEDDNPFILLSQDGAATRSTVGIVGNAGTSPQDLFYTGTLANATFLGTLDANGAVQFGTNGSVRMTIETGGNIGINTPLPATVLDVAGAFSMREMAAPALSPLDQGRVYFDATANKFKVSENGGAYVDLVGAGGGITGSGSAGQATFWTGASTVSGDSAFFWDNSNKRLGIGTAAPAQKLDVAGNIALSGDLGSTDDVFAVSTFTTPASRNRMEFTESEIRVGRYLDNLDFGNSTFAIEGGENATTGTFDIATLGFSNDSNRVGQTNALIASIVGYTDAGEGVNTGWLKFRTKDGTTLADRMSITPAGNIGIGISLPTSKLHLTGGQNLMKIISTHGNFTAVNALVIENQGGQDYMTIRNTTPGSTGRADLVLDAATGGVGKGASLVYQLNGVDKWRLAQDLNSGGDYGLAIAEDAAANVRMYFQPGGNVGIGESAPSSKLHVKASSATIATFDRLTTDGTIVAFRQDGVEEGSITVSDTTVSYNAFTGSHYAWTSQAMARGMLVSLTGKNRRHRDDPRSEMYYGIATTAKRNDPAVLGVYLSLKDPVMAINAENPHLVMSSGNSDVWVVDAGTNIAPGDFLISSDTPGHAMKDAGTDDVSHVVARAAEGVDWSAVTDVIDGKKHKKISITFANFDRQNGYAGVFTGKISRLTVDANLDFKGYGIENLAVLASLNGTWSIGGDGSIIAREIEVKVAKMEKLVIKNSAQQQTAGTAAILTGQVSAVVENPSIDARSLIGVTFKADPGSRWWVSEQSTGRFRVNLSSPANGDVSFTYWIVGME